MIHIPRRHLIMLMNKLEVVNKLTAGEKIGSQRRESFIKSTVFRRK